MKSLAILSVAAILVSSSAFARIKTATVTVSDPALKPTQFTLREQTTRSWLPGCTHYDVLQGTGWFPATFYFNADPSQQADGVYFYKVPQPSPLSKYCAAKTDNVANGLSMEYKNAQGDTIAYGGLAYRIEAKGQDVVEVLCQWNQGQNGDASWITCPEVTVSEADDIRLNIKLDVP